MFIAICSGIGKELLQEQGNLVDAGIAALLCLGVVHPHTAGLGQYCVLFFFYHFTFLHKSDISGAQSWIVTTKSQILSVVVETSSLESDPAEKTSICYIWLGMF